MTLDIKDSQHCTAAGCYTFSHTAGWCGRAQPRRCGCPFCYADEPDAPQAITTPTLDTRVYVQIGQRAISRELVSLVPLETRDISEVARAAVNLVFAELAPVLTREFEREAARLQKAHSGQFQGS